MFYFTLTLFKLKIKIYEIYISDKTDSDKPVIIDVDAVKVKEEKDDEQKVSCIFSLAFNFLQFVEMKSLRFDHLLFTCMIHIVIAL